MQILSCDNVKKVIIEKENITASEYTSENEKNKYEYKCSHYL